ncbi:MAG: branched-chain amino acid ABC transporter permease [Thermodesulfobacteriota bacterium]|nr:branched-chain amino acid ABC transporter permease [Thermodesulfobacteriota bacterium]
MELFIKLMISGLFTGSIYCLIAIGFVVVYKSTKVVNFSQGMLVVVGSYLVWTMLSISVLPAWIAVILGFVLTMILSLLLERVFMRPLVGQPIMASVMVTLALMTGLKGFVLTLWGPIARHFPVDVIPREEYNFGQFSISGDKAWTLISALALIVVLYLFFRFTRLGLGMKVTSEDHSIAQVVGLKLKNVFAASWAITGLVAAIGGLFLGTIISIHPGLEEIGLKALAAMLLGGLESIPGAIIGGLIIGLAETLAGQYLSFIFGPSVGEVFPYMLIIIVLMVRPYGLFGWRHIERV